MLETSSSAMDFRYSPNNSSLEIFSYLKKEKVLDWLGDQVYMSMIEDTMRSVKPYLEELLPHYPVYFGISYHHILTIPKLYHPIL